MNTRKYFVSTLFISFGAPIFAATPADGLWGGQIDNNFWISTQFGAPLPAGQFAEVPPVNRVTFSLVSLSQELPSTIKWSLGTTAYEYDGYASEFSHPGGGWVFGHQIGRGVSGLTLSYLGTNTDYAAPVYQASFSIPSVVIQPGWFLAIGGLMPSSSGAIAFAENHENTTLSFNGSSHYFSSIQAYPVKFSFSYVSTVPEPEAYAMMLVGLATLCYRRSRP